MSDNDADDKPKTPPEPESLSQSIMKAIKSLMGSKPEKVEMGSGVADKGKKVVAGRQKQIDDAVKAAGG